SAYFDQLHDTIDQSDAYIHTWDGELYLEYHRGTYTSQAYVKRMNRKLELLYRESEWLNVLSALENKSFTQYPDEKLTDGWKVILRNQFHDIIPGSSIKEVYEDAAIEYQEAEKLGQETWDAAAEVIVEKDTKDNTWTVINSSSWERTDLVFIQTSNGEDGVWMDYAGNLLATQHTAGGVYVQVENIPAMGYITIEHQPNKE